MLAQARGKRDLPEIQPAGGVVADMAFRIWGLRYLIGWMGVRPVGKEISRHVQRGVQGKLRRGALDVLRLL